LAHGDFGESLAYNQPVSKLLLPRCRNTLLLSATSLALSWSLALGLGFWAGAMSGGMLDRTLRVVVAILLAVPEIVAATLLVYWAARSGLLPTGGMSREEGNAWSDVARHLFLPVAVLTLTTFPMLFRHVRLSVQETLRAPFIRTAISFGIDPLRLMWRYVLPAAANPLFSLFGLSMAAMLSSSLIVEVVFGWPGLGPLFLDALFARDTYLLLAPVVISSFLLIAGNVLADILLFWNDPRIRTGAD
jgi:peptide/nickel transport system permease protein